MALKGYCELLADVYAHAMPFMHVYSLRSGFGASIHAGSIQACYHAAVQLKTFFALH
jgi:hypothetical protein